MSAIEYDIRTEAANADDAPRADELENMRPLPRISVHAFCESEALQRLMDQTAGVRRLGSAALSIAYVACGRLDGFFEDGLSLHDYGASALLVEEAGGNVSAFSGGPVTPNGDILAANTAVHSWLVDGLREG